MWINITTSGSGVRAGYGDGGGTPQASYDIRAAFTEEGLVIDNVWIHIAAVMYGPEAIDIYINGSKQSVTYEGTGGTYSAYGLPVSIGHVYAGGGNRYSTGKTSDPLIYTRALSPTEIRILARRSDPLLNGLIVPSSPPSSVQPLAINDRHWVGRSPDWHTAANWSRSQNGRGAAGVPNENTNVIFD
jgi:hypothetical protein